MDSSLRGCSVAREPRELMLYICVRYNQTHAACTWLYTANAVSRKSLLNYICHYVLVWGALGRMGNAVTARPHWLCVDPAAQCADGHVCCHVGMAYMEPKVTM
jgi:hypothetical protein